MRRATSFLLVGSALVAGAATLYVSSSGASFSGVSPPASSVAIYTPDGGPLRVGVDDSVRLDVSATTPAGTTLGVSGVDGTDVRVELNATSLATITAATGKGNCTYVESATNLAVGNTASAVPSSPMAGRTAITLTNWSAAKTVNCIPGGTPTATLGKVVGTNGAWWKWEGAAAGWVLSCICVAANGTATTGCTVQVEEEKCYQ